MKDLDMSGHSLDRKFEAETSRRRTFASPESLRAEFDRAFTLPERPERPPSSAYVSLRVAARHFALRADQVSGSRTNVPITRTPSSNPLLIGLANLNGAVMPVCDLRPMVNEPALPGSVEHAAGVIVLRHGERLAAIACDEVLGLEWVPDSSVHGTTVALREGAIPLLSSRDLLAQMFPVTGPAL